MRSRHAVSKAYQGRAASAGAESHGTETPVPVASTVHVQLHDTSDGTPPGTLGFESYEAVARVTRTGAAAGPR